MDNKVHICSDDKLNTSELIKKYDLHDQFATVLQFEPFNQFLLIGTNIGQIIFWEIDTGKTNGIYYPADEETITSMCTIPDTAYLLTSCSSGVFFILGAVNLISFPPLSFKY